MKKENQIQAQIYQWFNNNFCLKNHKPRLLIFAVPNGGTRNIREAMSMKATGTLAGASDLILVMDKEVIFVEIKAEKGRQSESQKDFQKRVEDLGFDYWLVYSFEDFQNKIKNIIVA